MARRNSPSKRDRLETARAACDEFWRHMAKIKKKRRQHALAKSKEMGEPPTTVMATLIPPPKLEQHCDLYSTACGADAWLQFDRDDDPKLRALNGKCVVIVSRCEGLIMTDEEDPRNPGSRLWVLSRNLRGE